MTNRDSKFARWSETRLQMNKLFAAHFTILTEKVMICWFSGAQLIFVSPPGGESSLKRIRLKPGLSLDSKAIFF